MTSSAHGGALARLEQALVAARRDRPRTRAPYAVPSLWLARPGTPRRVPVDPFAFYLNAVRNIRRRTPVRRRGTRATAGEWTKDAVIYNMFVRTTAAFDHNGNGALDLPVNAGGWRETGTFLKAIAMLPYIVRLGATTIHLLPITSIGRDGNKGTLGSPYAIRNPYRLDENLAEPAIGVDVETQFRAFVEAAHRLGLRVVVEFVFRTAAKDADWVAEHPEWFYWIREEIGGRTPEHQGEDRYGSPLFTREELDHIHRLVHDHRFDELVPPHPVYREMFTAPPERVRHDGERYVGTLPSGGRVKIPGAFADWPPDDNQPPWGDVTYLRMYDHPDFNYIAYNTIRMYDGRLARAANINAPLWDRIAGIIPHYQEHFGIDGVMIDMGHALPQELKSRMVAGARAVDPDFAFWDENFAVTHRSREEGYNAVFGFCWVDQHHPARFTALCKRLAGEGFPIPFFATPENHNTPRAAARPGGLLYARWAWVVNSFIPAVPFLHSGYELGETYPINTGLDFSNEDLRRLPSEKLPLFSEYGYDWLRKEQFADWVAKVSAVRKKYRPLVTNNDPSTMQMLGEQGDRVLAFARSAQGSRTRLAVVTSMNFAGEEQVTLPLGTTRPRVKDLLSGRVYRTEGGTLQLTLPPGGCMVFDY
jgi:hypothetical protein